MRIALDRLLELSDSLFYSVWSAFVPKIATSQIETVRLSVCSVGLGEPALLVAGQFQLQLRCNLLCDRLFDCNHIGNFAMVLFTPKLRACDGVTQIYLDAQGVLGLPHSPCQDRRHLQLAPDSPWINIFAFVLKSRRACRHSQSLQLGETIDERLRNSF